MEYDTGYYKVDILIKELNIVIEINGIQHGKNDLGGKYRTRTAVLEKLGYKVIDIDHLEDWAKISKKKWALKLIRDKIDNCISELNKDKIIADTA